MWRFNKCSMLNTARGVGSNGDGNAIACGKNSGKKENMFDG